MVGTRGQLSPVTHLGFIALGGGLGLDAEVPAVCSCVLPSCGSVLSSCGSVLPSCGPVPVLHPGIPAGSRRVLLSKHGSPRLLVPPSAGDLSQLMLLNYRVV